MGAIDGKELSPGEASLHLQKLASLVILPFSSIFHTCSRSFPSSFPLQLIYHTFH